MKITLWFCSQVKSLNAFWACKQYANGHVPVCRYCKAVAARLRDLPEDWPAEQRNERWLRQAMQVRATCSGMHDMFSTTCRTLDELFCSYSGAAGMSNILQGFTRLTCPCRKARFKISLVRMQRRCCVKCALGALRVLCAMSLALKLRLPAQPLRCMRERQVQTALGHCKLATSVGARSWCQQDPSLITLTLVDMLVSIAYSSGSINQSVNARTCCRVAKPPHDFYNGVFHCKGCERVRGRIVHSMPMLTSESRGTTRWLRKAVQVLSALLFSPTMRALCIVTFASCWLYYTFQHAAHPALASDCAECLQ